MRTRNEVAYSIMQLRRQFEAHGIPIETKSMVEYARDVLTEKARTAIDQVIESWPMSDVALFIDELEHPVISDKDALIHEKPMNRDPETTKRKPKGHKLSS